MARQYTLSDQVHEAIMDAMSCEREALEDYPRTVLVLACRREGLDVTGPKELLIQRLLDALCFGNIEAPPAPIAMYEEFEESEESEEPPGLPEQSQRLQPESRRELCSECLGLLGNISAVVSGVASVATGCECEVCLSGAVCTSALYCAAYLTSPSGRSNRRRNRRREDGSLE